MDNSSFEIFTGTGLKVFVEELGWGRIAWMRDNCIVADFKEKKDVVLFDPEFPDDFSHQYIFDEEAEKRGDEDALYAIYTLNKGATIRVKPPKEDHSDYEFLREFVKL